MSIPGMFPIAPNADPRFDSASMRNVAEVTTVSPTTSPASTSTRSPSAEPTRTVRGSSRPSPRRTNTRLRSPVESTAERGTESTSPRRGLVNRKVAYIPGLSRCPGFGSSTRTRAVRVSGLSVGYT